MEKDEQPSQTSNTSNGRRKSVITAVAYVAAIIVALVILTVIVGFFIPPLFSVIPAFALVFVTAVLVIVTSKYVEATNELVAAQREMQSIQDNQLAATNRLVSAEEDQAEAINNEVSALTDPILLVDIKVVEIVTQHTRGGLPPRGVSEPVALEVFIQNVGPGEAFDINFTQIEDFTFQMLRTQEPAESKSRSAAAIQHFNELKTLKDGVKRLAPHQKKRLARIVLKDNRGDTRQLLRSNTRSLSLTYKKQSSQAEIPDSFILDFPYYFELVDLLFREQQVV
jgi:low affinity Fe/Cu permease